MTLTLGKGIRLAAAGAIVAWVLPGHAAASAEPAESSTDDDLVAYEIEEGELAAAGLEDRAWAPRATSGVR